MVGKVKNLPIFLKKHGDAANKTSRCFSKYPGVFLNKGRGVFKNTPLFTQKTPYHESHDTLLSTF